MLIDWFTVGGQVLNFLVLVWLMKRFLYKPILNAIAEREKRVAAELADAAAKQTEAQKERDEFLRKNEDFASEREELLKNASSEANAEREKILDQARQAADVLTTTRAELVRDEARNLRQALTLRVQQEVLAITQKALMDLSTTGLEERLAEVFIRRLQSMEPKAKEALGAALKTAPAPAILRSAFELLAERRALIQTAVNETFAADIRLQFETSPDLIGGIELMGGGQKVAWSLADYLQSMEAGFTLLVEEQTKAEPRPAPAAARKAEKPPPESKPNPPAVVPAKTEAPTPKAEAKVEPKTVPPVPATPEPKVPAAATPATETPFAPKSAELQSAAELKPESKTKETLSTAPKS